MSNELKQRKYIWSNGFRFVDSGQVARGLDYSNADLCALFGIPRSMTRYTMENIVPQNEKQLLAINRLWEMFNTEPRIRTMVITGGNGTGKSVIGCALIHTLGRLSGFPCNTYDWRPYYINEAELLANLSGYNSGGFFTKLTRDTGVLVIDEFALTQWTPADKRKVEQVVNILHSNGGKIILLTNRRPVELYGQTGGAEPILSSQLRSRFLQGYNVELTGGDLRQGNSLGFEDDDDKDMPF